MGELLQFPTAAVSWDDEAPCIACGQRRPHRYADGTARAVVVDGATVHAFHAFQVSKRAMGRPKTAPDERNTMKRFLGVFSAALAASVVMVGNALAVTVPSVPVSAYGGTLLDELADAITAILPYAAAITAFAIGVGMLRRWLGHRKATSV